MVQPVPICFILATHEIRSALAFAAAKAGNNSAAKMAMIAMTTKSSINVKALFDLFILFTTRIWQFLICFFVSPVNVTNDTRRPSSFQGLIGM
jgi:hypothetical protein